MLSSRTRPVCLGSLLLGIALLASSCASGPFVAKRPFPFTEFVADGPLESVRPVDVLVAPVHNQSGDAIAPTAQLAKGLSVALVERLYSPLNGGGGGAVNASFDPRRTGADAVLQVVITRWDTRLLDTNNAVLAEVEARLFDGAGASRSLLWAVDLGRRLEVTTRMRERLPETEIRSRMADELANEILSLLPERNPLAD